MTRMLLVEAVTWIATRDAALTAHIASIAADTPGRVRGDYLSVAAAWIELSEMIDAQTREEARRALLGYAAEGRVGAVGIRDPKDGLVEVSALAFEAGQFGSDGLYPLGSLKVHGQRWSGLRFDRDALLSVCPAELRITPQPVKQVSVGRSVIERQTWELFDKGFTQAETVRQLITTHAPKKVNRGWVREEYRKCAAARGRTIRPGPRSAE
ncbi:hypothetical protein [Sphingomonas sp. BK580]|uniref:hypothetical protein n=1 Tax=Sphingomonas sp. BK580 TaxID=2586972 RepID=UPI00160EBBCC|nr:hypothetical protein [Sphingomonas sp. BK580]MBB3692468.1 hypothetical protein [Sphingomonas sp. BK580]